MWLWRPILRIKWSDKVRNEDVLQLTEEDNHYEFSNGKETEVIGHVLHHNDMLTDVTEGRILGKRSIGRRRYRILDDLMGSGSYEDMKRKTEDRTLRRMDLKERNCLRIWPRCKLCVLVAVAR